MPAACRPPPPGRFWLLPLLAPAWGWEGLMSAWVWSCWEAYRWGLRTDAYQRMWDCECVSWGKELRRQER